MKVIVNNPVPVPQPKKTYDLVGLTDQDILALRAICLRIGGSPEGYRGTFSRLSNALYDAVDLRGPNPAYLSIEEYEKKKNVGFSSPYDTGRFRSQIYFND